ncbi:MAG: potassium efflux system protein [Pirellulaceae bacterium]|jgi:potassium efflux system protein
MRFVQNITCPICQILCVSSRSVTYPEVITPLASRGSSGNEWTGLVQNFAMNFSLPLRGIVPTFLLFVVLASQSVYAQPSLNGPIVQPPITVESVELLKKQSAEATDLDADTKLKIEGACAQALDDLKRITDADVTAEQFKRDSEDVQLRVGTLRRTLAELQNDPPPLPTELTLAELEQEVSRRGVALAELKTVQAKSEAEPATRANRRREILALILSANQRIADIQKQLDTAAPSDEPALYTVARRAALQSREQLHEAEQPALQNEVAKYDAEDAVAFLRVERDVRTEEVAFATTQLDELQQLLDRQRAADSAATLQRARDAVASTPAPLKKNAEESVTFAEVAHALSLPIEEARRKLESTKIRLEGVRKQFTMTEQRVNDIGLTGSIGALLRRQSVGLPDLRRRGKSVQDRKTLIEDTQYALFEYDDKRSETAETLVQEILKTIAVQNADHLRLEAAVRTVVDQRREFLDGVIRNHNTYLDTLFELDATEQILIRDTRRYQSYINERVLWIRSNRTLFSSLETDASDWWIFDIARWNEVVQQLGKDIQLYPFGYAVAGVFFGILLWRKRHSRRELEAVGIIAERGSCKTIWPTLRAMRFTLMLAVVWPGIVFLIAWRLNASANGSQFAGAVAQALFALSWVYFPIELMRRVCRPRGLADAHFDWSASTVGVFRSNLRWLTLIGLSVVFVTSLLFASDLEHGTDTIERVCFVSGMLVLAVFIRRVLRPETGIFSEYLATNPGGWADRLKSIWYWGCIAIPVTIAGMTIAGYYYTAQRLTWRCYASVVFVVAIQLLSAFLRRLLLVRRRDVTIEQARERRASETASRVHSSDVPHFGPNQIVPPTDLQPDIAANAEQTRRLIRTGLIAVSLVGMWIIWVDVLPALRILDQWPVWTTTVSVETTTGEMRNSVSTMSPSSISTATTATAAEVYSTEVLRTVTIADIGLAVLIGIVTVVCARNIPGLMEITVLQRLPLDNSVRYAVTAITSYMIVLLGVIFAFNAISVGWSKVQWLATALTFGLAFGLQEIFANFVSGLILLFERPIRVGDVVTIDDISGVVARIRIRATTIINWDRKEYVIPNKELITGRLLNWTLSDKTNRILINVGIAYGSDVDKAKEVLLQTCNDHPLVLDDPPTVVTFEGFGDNSLNLVVRTFLPNLDNRLLVIDELHTSIDKVFRDAGIEIAFPQRDLHLRTVDAAQWNGLNLGNAESK